MCAKVTGPLMSLDASGTVGNTAVFSKWNGRNYVRLRVIPQNPQTDAQNLARVAIGSIGKATSSILTKFSPGATNGSQFYIDAVNAAPNGQSWNSYLLKTSIGVSQSAFSSLHSAYAGLSSEDKAIYVNAGIDAGIIPFSFGYGSITSITQGEMFYILLAFALGSLNYTLGNGSLNDPDANALVDFTTYMQTNVA